MRQIKIECNGPSVCQSKITDAETGEEIKGVYDLQVRVNKKTWMYEVDLTIGLPSLIVQGHVGTLSLLLGRAPDDEVVGPWYGARLVGEYAKLRGKDFEKLDPELRAVFYEECVLWMQALTKVVKGAKAIKESRALAWKEERERQSLRQHNPAQSATTSEPCDGSHPDDSEDD